MNEVLLLLAVLPVIAILYFIYTMDKKPEPKALLRKLFFGGVVGSITITMIISELFPVILGEDLYNEIDSATSGIYLFLNYFLMVGLVEEFSKWIMIYWLGYNKPEFDEMYDGIVYSAFVSLGFACLENILYVTMYGASTGIIRAFVSIPGHASFGVLMGYFLAKAKKADVDKKTDKNKYLLLSLICPAMLHGLFDTCLSADNFVFILIFYVLIIITNIGVVITIIKISKRDERITFGKRIINAPRVNFCPFCGKPDVNTRYCVRCGNKIRD